MEITVRLGAVWATWVLWFVVGFGCGVATILIYQS